jgi:hypothetical protein
MALATSESVEGVSSAGGFAVTISGRGSGPLSPGRGWACGLVFAASTGAGFIVAAGSGSIGGLAAVTGASAGTRFGMLDAALKGGAGVGSSGFFRALKKMSGQRMAVRSGVRFQGEWMHIVRLRRQGNRYHRMMKASLLAATFKNKAAPR